MKAISKKAQRIPAKAKQLAAKLAKDRKKIHTPEDETKIERLPAHGFPVIMRKQVAKDLVQLTLANKRWYIKEKDKNTILVVPGTTYVIDSVYSKGKGYENWVGSMGVADAARILQETGKRGTRVHAAIAHCLLHGDIDFEGDYDFLEGRPFTASEFNYLHHWGNWWRTFSPIAQQIEMPFFDEAEGYAGTLDLNAVIDKGAITSFNARKKENGLVKTGEAISALIDWKSTGDIYDSARMQIAAYMHSIAMPYGIIVRLGAKNKNGYEMEVFEMRGKKIVSLKDVRDGIERDYLAAFKHCLGLFNIFYGDEMPDVVSFNRHFKI